jgi:hypothetical protein
MVKRIRALNRQEFEAATSNGAVYGKYLSVYVYAELGREDRYRESPKDDSSTSYRLFRNCTAFYARTLDQLRNGDYEYDTLEDILIVYY